MQNVYQSATDVISRVRKEKESEGKLALGLVEAMLEKITPWLEEQKVTTGLVAWIKSITTYGTPWFALFGLISRPWFSRVWIIQEVAMAKQVLVYNGPHQLDWVDLLYSSIFISRNQFLINPLFFKDLEFFRRIWAAAKHIVKVGAVFGGKASLAPASLCKGPLREKILKREVDHQALYNLLCCFRTFKATDERNRVYALLQLLNTFKIFRVLYPWCHVMNMTIFLTSFYAASPVISMLGEDWFSPASIWHGWR